MRAALLLGTRLLLGLRFLHYAEALALGPQIRARYDCPSGYATVTVITNVLVNTVLINTYCTSNTVLIIEGGITIQVTNAPVQLVTTVTATKTVVVTDVPLVSNPDYKLFI